MRKKKYDIRIHPFLFFQTEMINQMVPVIDPGTMMRPGTTAFFHIHAELIPNALEDFTVVLGEGLLWGVMEQEAIASDLHHSTYRAASESSVLVRAPYQACAALLTPFACEEEFDAYGRTQPHLSYADVTYDHITPHIETLDLL